MRVHCADKIRQRGERFSAAEVAAQLDEIEVLSDYLAQRDAERLGGLSGADEAGS